MADGQFRVTSTEKPTDRLGMLNPASWRGIVFPLLTHNVGFSHENAPHKFQYRNNEYIETSGAKAWSFRYTIPMRDSVTVGPYRRLFSEILPAFVNAMRDKSPGVLIDPVYGEFRCVPAEFNEETDPRKRCGVDITVEFIHSPEIDETLAPLQRNPSFAQLTDEAGRLDAQVEALPWDQEEKPPSTVDPLLAVSGAIRQIEFAGNKTLAGLERNIDNLEAVERSVDRLADPRTFSLKRRSRRTREASIRAKESAQDPTRRIRVAKNKYAQTISQIAREHGMSIVEFIKLNPSLASSPEVRAGAPINVFAQKPAA